MTENIIDSATLHGPDGKRVRAVLMDTDDGQMVRLDSNVERLEGVAPGDYLLVGDAEAGTSPPPSALTETEKAYFDTIRQVITSPRPRDLRISRMRLDGRDVAVIMQRIIDAQTAETLGFMPLAILLDDATAVRLRDVHGRAPFTVAPGDAEGAG